MKATFQTAGATGWVNPPTALCRKDLAQASNLDSSSGDSGRWRPLTRQHRQFHQARGARSGSGGQDKTNNAHDRPAGKTAFPTSVAKRAWCLEL
jgi:hypothetical protein